jgi:hypothetical protein
MLTVAQRPAGMLTNTERVNDYRYATAEVPTSAEEFAAASVLAALEPETDATDTSLPSMWPMVLHFVVEHDLMPAIMRRLHSPSMVSKSLQCAASAISPSAIRTTLIDHGALPALGACRRHACPTVDSP